MSESTDPIVGNIIDVPFEVTILETGAHVDPTTLTALVTGPDGVPVEYSYPDPGHLIRQSVGYYTLSFTPDAPGRWFWEYDTTGEGAAAADGYIDIRAAASAGGLSSPRGLVRLEINDQNGELFEDFEIDAVLERNSDDPLLAAADLCEILARRFALQIDFEWQGQSFKQSGRAKVYADLAASLRTRALQVANGGTIGTIEIHRDHCHRHRGDAFSRFDCDFDTTLIRERDC